jgi:hypothetical protein
MPATVAGDAWVVSRGGQSLSRPIRALVGQRIRIPFRTPAETGMGRWAGSRWVWRYWTFWRTPRLIQVWPVRQYFAGRPGGRWRACSRVCVYESASSHPRGAVGVWRCARRTGRPEQGVRGSVADGSATAKVRRSAHAIRAYGALARDAPSLPAALQRREGLACGGTMAVRWRTAGMLEADHQFRRVNGHLHLPKLRAAPRRPLQDCQCREPE